MRRVLLAGLNFLILGLAIPAFGAEDIFLPDNPLEGRELFTSKHCIRCHSIQGVGGRAGPDLGDVALGSLNTIISSLWNHFPRMIEVFEEEHLEWPELDALEARKLVTFLYFLNYLDKAANASVGERIFHEKNCVRCHSVGGRGGKVGPELDFYQTRFAAPFITAELWNKGPKMMRTMRKERVPRPQFQERDVVDILAYIRVGGLSEKTTRTYLPPANPNHGRDVFKEKNCTKCHAVNGNGGSIAPDLAMRNLKGSLSYILSVMWNHGANMWPRMAKEEIPFPEFSAEEMSDLMSYLYFIQFKENPGSSPRGREVFAEKKCKSCHESDNPEKEPIGPNLADAGLNSHFDIISALWNHAPAIKEQMTEENIRWPILGKDEMRDLVEYILALK